MGCYVNPQNTTKEKWLSENAEVTRGPCEITETHLPVCLVDNGFFKAAGVAYDQRELDAFQYSEDQRPRIWLKVERAKLYAVSDLASYEKEKT